MTSIEPAPVALPHLSPLALRLYNRLPRIYRILDARHDHSLLRYIGGAMTFGGDLDAVIEALRGTRPVGPATPEPWDLDAADLELWRESRRQRLSVLTDPLTAPPEYLPYIAQLVGATLHPQASLQERRDTISSATSGYRAGTKAALADAARSALTGSRYVLVQPFTRGDGTAGSLWDVTVRTRSTETPDAAAVLATIVRKGAKPAGVRLWHAAFGTSWDKIEALFPTWTDWEGRAWDEIEEAGITYADVPDNQAPGASFETAGDVAKWAAAAEGGGSVPTWALASNAGLDGANAGRLTKVGATGGMRTRSQLITGVLPGREYLFSVSGKPSVAVPVTLSIEWLTAGGAAISTTPVAVGTAQPAEWNRGILSSRHTSPATTAQARLNIAATGTVAAGVTLDLDAVLYRLVTAGGG